MELGPKGAVIINTPYDGEYLAGNFTLYDGMTFPDVDWIPTLSISYSDGQILKGNDTTSAVIEVSYGLYEEMNGTAMAAPHVAGATAMLLSISPTMTNEEVREILNEAAMDLGLEQRCQGNGLIRLNAAIDMLFGVDILSWEVNEEEENAVAVLKLKKIQVRK